MPKPYEIIVVPNRNLKEVAQPVTSFNDVLDKKIEKIIEVLRSDENGVGLSANQLGINDRICVTEFIDKENKEDSIPLQVFINPLIAEVKPEYETLDEGCLSVPKIELPVERSTKIKIKARNQQGRKIRLTAKGLLARVLQHEIDHLNGILFTDRVKKELSQKYPQYKNLKIIFIGTGGNLVELILEGLILLDFKIAAVITTHQSPVGEIARKFEKNPIETNDINQEASTIKKIDPDLIITADFGQIIPKKILGIPHLGAINIHYSLLPKFRGPTPVQTAILSGGKETGVSIFKMSPKIDEGPILAQEKVEISDYENAAVLRTRLSSLTLKMLTELLPKMQQGEVQAIPQDNSKATLTRKFSKSDGEINWQKDIQSIERRIRAYCPWPGSYTFIDGKRLLIHLAHLDDKKLVLDIVQGEGKKPMKFSDFIRGFHGKKPGWFKKIKI